MSATPVRVTLVVACALVDADKRVLIAQRPEGKALAGGFYIFKHEYVMVFFKG